MEHLESQLPALELRLGRGRARPDRRDRAAGHRPQRDRRRLGARRHRGLRTCAGARADRPPSRRPASLERAGRPPLPDRSRRVRRCRSHRHLCRPGRPRVRRRRPVAVPGPRIDRGGVRPGRVPGHPPDPGQRGGRHGGVRGGRSARRPHRAQSHSRGTGSASRRARVRPCRPPRPSGCCPRRRLRTVVLRRRSTSTPASTTCACATASCSPPPSASHPARRWPTALPDGHRVLRLRRGRARTA